MFVVLSIKKIGEYSICVYMKQKCVFLNEGHALLTLVAGVCGGGATLGGVNIKRQYTQYNDLQSIERK